MTQGIKFNYHRIVIKLGTSLLTGGGKKLNKEVMSNLVSQITWIHKHGLEVIIVSSGAIAAGRNKLGLTKKLRGIPYRQVLAAVGQNRLMYHYEQMFTKHGITVAQALLTKTDLADRLGYLNTRNTLLALMDLQVICIVNENDVVAVDEIEEGRFGDNDNLSAMVANLVDADLLIILTDIPGLYTADPRHHPEARLIAQVDHINNEIERFAAGSTTKLGTGGMITKIEAAKLATSSGVNVIIANGLESDILHKLITGESIGTFFHPATSKLESRQRWMLSGLSNRGGLKIDTGAAIALRKQNRSLLAAGIKEIEGSFKRGDIVTIYGLNGDRIGYGISNYSTAEINKIKGSHSKDIAPLLGHDYGSEVVHRNNLVIL